jgi:hypothetical protein
MCLRAHDLRRLLQLHCAAAIVAAAATAVRTFRRPVAWLYMWHRRLSEQQGEKASDHMDTGRDNPEECV